MYVSYCRSRGDLYKNITPDYYGYRDDDDQVLAPKELEREVSFATMYTLHISTNCFLSVCVQAERVDC
jgi:hypothetical protein